MTEVGSRLGMTPGLPRSGVNDAHTVVEEKPWTVFLLFLSVFIAIIVPLLLVTHPLQIDMPQHLARHYIGNNIALSDYLSRFYTFEWQAIPYVAGDALHQVLGKIFSVYDAGRIVLGFVFLIWLSSAMLLHRVFWGAFSVWPLLCVLLFLNANVGWGFENYLLGSAFALLLFVGWVSWKATRLAPKAIAFTLLATLLYFTHIFAFAVFGVLYLTYELGKHWGGLRKHPIATVRLLTIIALPMVPGSVHFLTLIMFSAEYTSGSTTIFGNFITRVNVLTGSVSARFFDMPIDHVVLTCLFFIFAWGLVTKRLSVHPSMKLVVVVLGVLCLVVPWKLAGVSFSHYRLPFVFVLLLIASSRWEGLKSAHYWSAVAALGLLIVVRTFMVVDYWRPHDTEVKELIQSFDKLEKGATLLPVWNDPQKERNHWYSAAYAIIERDAFVPVLFSELTLLGVQPEFRRINRMNNGMSGMYEAQSSVDNLAATIEAVNDGEENDQKRNLTSLRDWWRSFSHVLIIDHQKQGNPSPDHLHLVHDGSYFALYRNMNFDPPSE